jgi:hypothetical protein
MKQKRGQQKSAADIWAHRDDPGEWSDKAVAIEVKPSRMELVSFRIPSDELDELQSSAAAAGESLSHFVRMAVALRLGRSNFVDNVEVTTGVQGAIIQGLPWVTAPRTWGDSRRRLAFPESESRELVPAGAR